MKNKTHKKTHKDWRRQAEERLAWYRKVTDIVLPAYQEIKSTVGSISSTAFYKRLSGEGASASNGGIAITPIDYVADVDLVLKKLLSSLEYAHFDSTMLTEKQREQIGKELSRRRIFPIKAYMAQVRK